MFQIVTNLIPLVLKLDMQALYWGAVTSGAAPITNVKFKMPTGGYNDVTGTVIYNAGAAVIGTSKPYACFCRCNQFSYQCS